MSQAIALTDLDWEADAYEALVKVAAAGKPFDAYTLSEVAELRDPPHPNQWSMKTPPWPHRHRSISYRS